MIGAYSALAFGCLLAAIYPAPPNSGDNQGSDQDERVHASRGTALFRLVPKRCYRQPLQLSKTVLKRALAIS